MVEVFAIRVVANDELSILYAINILHFLHPNHSVRVSFLDAKSVSYLIELFEGVHFFTGNGDIVFLSSRFLNVVIHSLRCR